MIKSIKGIIFDMDGTLYPYDSEEKKYKNSTKQKIIYDNKIKIIKKYKKNITDSEIQEILEQSKKSKLDSSVFLSQYLNLNIDIIFEEKMNINPIFIKYDENIVRLLTKLQRENIKLFLVTGSPKVWSDNCLQKLKIKDFFVEILNNNFYPEKKENAYSKIVKKYKLDSSEVLVIGDNYKNDIEPAEKLNFHVIYQNFDIKALEEKLKINTPISHVL